MRYDKPWLSLDQQVALLSSRGLAFPDRDSCLEVLQAVGYYRLSGYLHPFRRSEPYADESGRSRRRVLSGYRPGTTLAQASALIDFDRRLRILALEGIERIEVSLRMQLGYALGRRSPFAHLEASTFVASFVEPSRELADGTPVSTHVTWLEHVRRRQACSDETFVQHFRDAYDGEMPIWALTEILELGQLGRLSSGLERSLASEIAAAYGVPTKKMLTSWISSLNHVRNLSAETLRAIATELAP
jgi:abortive infection bacteriophage resistance protein